MKTKLLSLLFSFGLVALHAQTTHMLNWQIGSTSPTTDLTINVGDTVEWTWTDAAPHTVQNNVGSTETFNSGMLTGIGQKFSYTFNFPGVNPYFCGIHGAGNMSGTITVQSILGIGENEKELFAVYPNPASSFLNLKLSQTLNEVQVDVFDVLGKKIFSRRNMNTNKPINISRWNSGVYLIRLTSERTTQTKRFVKQ